MAGDTQTLHPNETIALADGDSYWSVTKKNTVNDVDGFLIGKIGENSFINEAGGAGNTGLGYWGSATDRGSTYFVDDVPEIPVTNVYYDITFNGAVAHTISVSGMVVGDDVPEMPTVTCPAYTTITAPDVTGQTVTENMRIEVPATWVGPFELSADFDHAHWYDMAIRSTWYVTSGNKDGDGALKTVNANALGLGEDAYHWAFVGDPWHIQVYNKAEGATKNFGYPTQANQGVPSFQTDTYYWTIKASTSGIDNSFVMNVGGKNLYINQYGGAGGSLKFWDSGNNISDGGSAFTVFDIPNDYSKYVAAEISPYLESTAKYFVLKPEVAANVGYDEAYKTNCTFEQYKAMKLAFMDINMSDLDNFVLPETGLYYIKNKNYNKYMGADRTQIKGNLEVEITAALVKLTKSGNKYSISLQGKYAPATVAQSADVKISDEEAFFTLSIPTIGYAAFQADPSNNMSCLHCSSSGNVVGWEAPADASQWTLEEPTSVNVIIKDNAGYATTYLPFSVTIPEGVTANTVTINTDGVHLNLSPINEKIPADTPVLLAGENGEPLANGTYKFEITTGGSSETDNVLVGTYERIPAADGNYVLQKQDDVIGFYQVDTNIDTPNIPAYRAYLSVPEGTKVKAFYFGNITDAIQSVQNADGQNVIYNVAGQRLNKLQRGVNIVNGKKVIVK